MNKEQFKYLISSMGVSTFRGLKSIIFVVSFFSLFIWLSRITPFELTKTHLGIFILLPFIIAIISSKLKKKNGIKLFVELCRVKGLNVNDGFTKSLKDYFVTYTPDVAVKLTDNSPITVNLRNDGVLTIVIPTLIDAKYKLYEQDSFTANYDVLGLPEDATGFDFIEKMYVIKNPIKDPLITKLIVDLYNCHNFERLDIEDNKIILISELGFGLFGMKKLNEFVDWLEEMLLRFDKIESDLIQSGCNLVKENH